MAKITLKQFTITKPYPDTLKILDIGGNVLFPRGHLPLTLTDKRHLGIINDALKTDRLVGVIQKRGPGQKSDLYSTGCLARITMFTEINPYSMMVVVTGIARFRRIKDGTPNFADGEQVSYDDYVEYPDDAGDDGSLPLNRDALLALLASHMDACGIDANWDDIRHASSERLITALAMICPFNTFEKQALLETPTLEDRCHMLMALMEVSYLKQTGLVWKH